MKTIKFRDYLVPLVLSGKKISTWRLFDDKDLSAGDVVELQVFVTKEVFAKARIERVVVKPFKMLNTQDKAGHESFASDLEMYKTYSEYYQVKVDGDTPVKIIWFELLST